MNDGAKIFDRYVACGFALALCAVAVLGMWYHNAEVAEFGKLGFATFSGVVVMLLNKELLSGKNGSGTGNPT